MRHPVRLCFAALVLACRSEADLDSEVPRVEPGLPLEVGPPVQVDVVRQVVNPVVDVLWVLDNSPSMQDERAALATAFPSFVDPFVGSGVDWHIGVVSTDLETEGHAGRLRDAFGLRWIDGQTKDPAEVFRVMATEALTDGTLATTTDEQGRHAVLLALDLESREGGYNEGFFRRDLREAYLHVIVVTDEDDNTDPQVLPTDVFAEWFLGLKTYGRATFNSVVSWVTCCGNERGESYLGLTDTIGGTAVSLHLVDWPALLAELGTFQAPEPAVEFFLTRPPVPETIEVRATTAEGVTVAYARDEAWTYDAVRNSVRFVDDVPPPLGAELRITYEVRTEGLAEGDPDRG